MPPTGINRMWLGKTARIDFTTEGLINSAGKIFKPLAPKAMARNASEGVATPGKEIKPKLTASHTTLSSRCGEMMICPPAVLMSRTCCAVVTVPAPTKALGNASDKI